MRKSRQELRDDFNHSGFDFLTVDLDTPILFTERAFLSKGDPQAEQRNVTNARKGYEAVTRLREKLKLDSEEQGAFEAKRMNLKKALERLGEQF